MSHRPAIPRPVLGALGLAVLGAAWLGPLPGLARHAFAAHMAMHMAVVAVAAPLLALAIAGGRLDVARRAPALVPPIPVSLVELAVVWGWHAPDLHRAARHEPAVLAVEQGTFVAAGLLVWLSAGGGDPRDRGRTAAGVVALLLTSMHMTLLGALLALPQRPLYAHATGLGGLTALQDQQLGGAIMLVAGGAAYLLGGLWLTAAVLRPASGEPRGAAPGVEERA